MTCCCNRNDQNEKIKVVFKEFDFKKRPCVYISTNPCYSTERQELAKLLYTVHKYCLNLDVCETSRVYMSLDELENMVSKGKNAKRTSAYYWIAQHFTCAYDVCDENTYDENMDCDDDCD